MQEAQSERAGGEGERRRATLMRLEGGGASHEATAHGRKRRRRDDLILVQLLRSCRPLPIDSLDTGHCGLYALHDPFVVC